MLRLILINLFPVLTSATVLAETAVPDPHTSPVVVAPLASPAGSGSLAPRLARLNDGRVVMSWLQASEGGHSFQYAVLENDAFGTASTIAAGDDFFANWADTPGIVEMPDGSWLAHWLVRSGQGTYAYDVRVAIGDDQGANWAPAFSPHDDGTFTEHGFVSHYPTSSLGTGLVWLDGRDTAPAKVDGGHAAGHDGHASGGAMTLRTAWVDPEGDVHEGALLDARVCDCCGTAAALTDEGPVVVYRDRSEDEIRDIMLVRQSTSGWSEPVPVHEDGWQINACPVNGPAILARGATVIVAWFTMAGDGVPRVRVAQSTDAGRTFGEPVTLDAGVALGRVDLAWAADGFIVSWLADAGDTGVVRAAHFDKNTRLVDRADLVHLDAGRSSGFPRLATLGDGRWLLAWTDDRVRAGIITPR